MTVWMYDDRKVAFSPPVVVYTHTEMGIKNAACTHTRTPDWLCASPILLVQCVCTWQSHVSGRYILSDRLWGLRCKVTREEAGHKALQAYGVISMCKTVLGHCKIGNMITCARHHCDLDSYTLMASSTSKVCCTSKHNRYSGHEPALRNREVKLH